LSCASPPPEERPNRAGNVAGSITHRSAFEAHFRRLYFGYRMLPFYKNAQSSATVRIQELLVQGMKS
jgi:hypothetical protein